MQGLFIQCENLIKNLIGYTSPTTWSVFILIIILFRSSIANLIIKIGHKVLKLEYLEDESKAGRNISNLIILLGLWYLANIWIKDARFISTSKKIYKALFKIFITGIIIDIISPEGAISRLSKRSKNKKFSNISSNVIINNFLFKIVKIIVYIILTALILNDFGYNINGLVAGLGIGSAIIALAIQDFVKSLVSGASIVSEKPFVVGDFIAFNDQGFSLEGTVEDITLRNTKIRLLNNSLMHIPNSKITTSCVTNYNKIENRRIEMKLHLPLDLTTEKIHRIISKIRIYLESNNKVLKETVYVGFTDINEYSNDILIMCYIDESKYKRYLQVIEVINFAIMEILSVENVMVAKPTRTIEIIDREMQKGEN